MGLRSPTWFYMVCTSKRASKAQQSVQGQPYLVAGRSLADVVNRASNSGPSSRARAWPGGLKSAARSPCIRSTDNSFCESRFADAPSVKTRANRESWTARNPGWGARQVMSRSGLKSQLFGPKHCRANFGPPLMTPFCLFEVAYVFLPRGVLEMHLSKSFMVRGSRFGV